MNAYVGLSNKTDFFKIKCDENDSKEIVKSFMMLFGNGQENIM